MAWSVEDYTIHERRTWRKVRPQDQIPVTMTPRTLTAIVYRASKQLAEAIAEGKATPPPCQFNRGGFDADRLPTAKERAGTARESGGKQAAPRKQSPASVDPSANGRHSKPPHAHMGTLRRV